MDTGLPAPLTSRMAEVQGQVSAALDATLDLQPPGELTDAMRYACEGGKRIRAFLVLESAQLHGVPDAAALPVAEAVEMLHAYSLIHDDLPAIDNDDLRRGRPTCHVRFDEATAILAGDALQSLAFERLADPAIGGAEARVELVRRFAQAVGARGMVWGQMQDIAAETAASPLSLDQIVALQDGKTGALIGFAATAGAVIAQADPAPLGEYARNLGLAFQIADDILDVTGTQETTGKRVGKDAAAGKATFVSRMGLDRARTEAQAMVDRAEAALEVYQAAGGQTRAAENLRQLARFVIHRQT
ncbi:polyprenyl synthetase family protein [Paracoccus aeridis]|uniref:polyprenyl synthetase family protein n=1 Tax=Paracoccus aeridis TaxID=1966466 RepID=UPI001F228548|nr:farnesyl diphosphate synthase [Paracoccus aeridis]